jgi:hypothetical protein
MAPEAETTLSTLRRSPRQARTGRAGWTGAAVSLIRHVMNRPAPEHDLAAVRALAERLGLGRIEPVVLRLAKHTVVRLGRLPLVARVQSAGPLDPALETMARELQVVQHLAHEGAPVVPPSRDPPPGVYEVNGCAISLWSYVEHRPGEDRDVAAAGEALKRVHAGLASYQGDLPPFTDAIASCEALLDDPSALRTISAANRAFLADRYRQALAAIPWAGLRPVALHGDTQFGNLFMTAHGPLWGDFEAVCMGPLEWDLVDKPPAMRNAFAGLDPALLDSLAALRLVCLVIWCWADAERSGEMRDAATYHLRRLKRARA